MSTYAAIAGVSSTLRNLLMDRMEQAVPVTIAPPDVNVAGVSGKRLNLYLFQVTESAALRNQDFAKGGDAGSYGRPPLSLELHYLVTAFGGTETASDADLQAQLVLGDAMRVFHEVPILTSKLHEDDLPGSPLIFDPVLLGAVENLRVTLQPMSLEEVTKIWSALPNAEFRRSVIYLVTVVQIESRRQRRPAVPVRTPRAIIQTYRVPALQTVRRAPPFTGMPAEIAESGDTITLLGSDLSAQIVKIRIGSALIDPLLIGDDSLSAVVPSTVRAGVQSVSVLHGAPLVPDHIESNAAALAVAPRVVGVAPPSAAPGATVTVTVSPLVHASQEKKLILGDRMIDAIAVAPDAPPSATIQFKMPAGAAAVPAGKQLLRVRVDGVDSRLIVNPNTGDYTGPSLIAT